MNRWHVRYRYRSGETWVYLPDTTEAVARACYAERKQHLSRIRGSRVELVGDGQVMDFADGGEFPQLEVPHGA